MASLGLKALLYGVDKIPDQWFEKVPGGYYKNTEGREQARPEQARQSQKKHGKDKRRPHREYDDDNDGYRSEGEQYARDQRGRRGHNYEDDGYGDTRGGRDRARSMGDRDYGGQAGYSRQRGYNQGDFAQDDGDDDYAGRSGHDNRYGAAAGAGAGVASAAPYYDRPASSGPAAGYVPYADVYGPQSQNQYPADTRYDRSNVSMPYDNNGRPYSQEQHPQHYQSEAREYGRQSCYQEDDRRSNGSRSRSRSRSSDEEEARRRRRRNRKKRDESRGRRSRPASPNNQARGKSTLRDRFDTSERGIGYGTVGALAGGLIGSEIGKGLWPTVAGAVVGGLGANAFESREKQKESKARSAYESRDIDRRDNDRRDGDRKRRSRRYDD